MKCVPKNTLKSHEFLRVTINHNGRFINLKSESEREQFYLRAKGNVLKSKLELNF